MAEIIKLGIFDLDGTVSTKKGISESINKGFNNLHRNGIETTLITGKGHRQLRHRLGNDWGTLISEKIPVGVENGGRLVDSQERNLEYHPLSNEEIETVNEIIFKHPKDIVAVAYHPNNPKKNMVAWSPSKEDITNLVGKDLSITDIPLLNAKEFFRKVHSDNPCMLVVVAKENNIQEAFPAGLNIVTNEGVININTEGTNKGTCVVELSELAGISLPNILIAGNDENDIPMLSLPVGARLFIANKDGNVPLQGNITQLDSPDELGKYLSSFN